MHDLVLGIAFVAMILSPCLVALKMGDIEDAGNAVPESHDDVPSYKA